MNAFRVLLASVALLLALVVAAVVDHEFKSNAMAAAHEDQWFCRNRGVRCGGEQPEAIERRWHTRELSYEFAFAGVAFFAAGTAAYRLVSRPRS